MYDLFWNPEGRFSRLKAQSLAKLKYNEPHLFHWSTPFFNNPRLKTILEHLITNQLWHNYTNQYTKFDENPKIFSWVKAIIFIKIHACINFTKSYILKKIWQNIHSFPVHSRHYFKTGKTVSKICNNFFKKTYNFSRNSTRMLNRLIHTEYGI